MRSHKYIIYIGFYFLLSIPHNLFLKAVKIILSLKLKMSLKINLIIG